MSEANVPASRRRQVSLLLGLGILLVPFVFGWVTLLPGYSAVARIVSWAWGLVMIILTVAVMYDGNGSSTGDINKLFSYYERLQGDGSNGDQEEELIGGRVLKECQVGGKYPAYFGWVNVKLTFVSGYPVTNQAPEKWYVFAVDYGDHFSGMTASEQTQDRVQSIYAEMGALGCPVSDTTDSR